MKVAVIGAGSTYTPELVSGMGRERERIGVDDVALHDTDAERRDTVGHLAERMLRRQGFEGRIVITGDLERAVEDADFVLIQIRVGGQRARLADETIPLQLDRIGQETTGAGGLAKAFRTVPVVLEIADAARKRAAPDAWIIDFTNPVGIVTRALLDAGHRAVGLCNVAIGFQRHLAGLLGVDPGRVVVDHVGLNHLSWIRAVRVDREDVLPALLESFGEALADHVGLPLRLLDRLRAIPSPYLRYYYRHDEMLEEQRSSAPRAARVAEIEAELLRMYRDPQLTEKPVLLEQRGGAYYSESAIGLMASLVSGDDAIHVVDMRNGTTIEGLAGDDVVEVPARVGGSGVTPLPQTPLPHELLGLVQHVAAYERLAARAAALRDIDVARAAALAHPLLGQERLAEAVVDLMLRGAPA